MEIAGEIKFDLRRHFRPGGILQTEQLHDLDLVETDNRLAIDDRYRRALKPLIDQLFHRHLIGADIFLDELNALLR